MPELIWSLHLAATAVMTGVIWFVQFIQYPWFHQVPTDRFPAYHRDYTRRVGWIVGPTMLVEAASGVVLWWQLATGLLGWHIAGMALLAICWLSTAFLQIPCHLQLGRGYDPAVHARLVHTNWIRTIGWSLRLALLIAMAARGGV